MPTWRVATALIKVSGYGLISPGSASMFLTWAVRGERGRWCVSQPGSVRTLFPHGLNKDLDVMPFELSGVCSVLVNFSWRYWTVFLPQYSIKM